MQKVTINTLKSMKQKKEKIPVLTCYDATFSKVLNDSQIPVLLVGDTLGMVLQGNDSTLPVTIKDMAYHTKCVKQGNSFSFIISDLPFMTYYSPDLALQNASSLMQAGAHMVKIEGGRWLSNTITRLAENGVPVCAHLGLTPQTVNVIGGYKLQGKTEIEANELIETAKQLEKAGAAMILLECVPTNLAFKITQNANIPVIGIGAGGETDGQVLVLHDMLGLTQNPPKFAYNFMKGQDSIQKAIKSYITCVKNNSFPNADQQYIL